jgi:outer membrane autotransporter protein
VGINKYDQKRAINFLGQTASASYQGTQTQAKLTGGYDFPLSSGVTATPQASLQLLSTHNRGYAESGSTVNQTVASQNFGNVESVIGGKLTKSFDTGIGPISFDARAGWVHDYERSQISTTATLAGVGYVVSTARLPGDGVQLGLGGTLQKNDNLSLRLEYEGDLRPAYESHTALFKVRETF